MTEKNNIPKHWEIKKLEEVAKWGSGGTPTSTNSLYYGGDIPWLIIGDLNDSVVTSSEKTITDLGLKNSSAKIVKPNSVLIAMYGSIGKLGINKIPVATNQAIAFTSELYQNIYNKYLFYFLLHNRSNLLSLGKGGTQKNISQTVLKQIKIPLPSLVEQKSIVSKIEELLSELENGKQQLLTAQQQLKVYRQSLLKWAFEGNELVPFETFVDTSQNGLSKRMGKIGIEFKVLRLADITKNIIDNSNPRTIVMDANEIAKYKLKTDDLICVRVNGSKDLVGKLVHVSSMNEEDNWAFCDHFIRVRLQSNNAYSKYFHYYFSTVKMRKYIHDNMVTSAGQNTVSQGTIKNAPVPNSSIEQQHQIVSALETKLTICDKIEETISQSLQQAETLRQSILKKAFEGRLV